MSSWKVCVDLYCEKCFYFHYNSFPRLCKLGKLTHLSEFTHTGVFVNDRERKRPDDKSGFHRVHWLTLTCSLLPDAVSEPIFSYFTHNSRGS